MTVKSDEADRTSWQVPVEGHEVDERRHLEQEAATTSTHVAVPPALAYRVKQVSMMLNLPISTVHDMVRRRTIESVKFGDGRKKQILITACAVQDFLLRYRVPVRNGKRSK